MVKALRISSLLSAIALLAPATAFAAEGDSANFLTPLSAAIAIGLAALGGTLSQGKAIAAALDAMGRNPSGAGPVRMAMIIGLVFIESLVILGFVIAFTL